MARKKSRELKIEITETVSVALTPVTPPTSYPILNAGESVNSLYVDDALESNLLIDSAKQYH